MTHIKREQNKERLINNFKIGLKAHFDKLNKCTVFFKDKYLVSIFRALKSEFKILMT